MKIYDILEIFGAESFAADPTPAFRGRMYLNTVSGLLKWYNGTSWLSVAVGGGATVTNSRGAPGTVVAGAGVSISGAPVVDEVIYITGGAASVVVVANPQVSAGNTVGQTLELVGRDSTNYVDFADGTGLSLNGAWRALADSVIGLRWDGVSWVERYRS